MSDKIDNSSSHSNHLSGKKRKASDGNGSNGYKKRKISNEDEEESIITNTKDSIKMSGRYNYEEDDEDSNIKWKTLEHHGVRFPPFYTPHGVAPLHKGKPLILNPVQEEIATFWAQALGTDFTEKETVRNNFEEEFLAVLDKEMGVKSLNNIDFDPIVKHIEKTREERNNRPREEKKREREENAKLDAHFRYCIIDGEKERVNTVMVEPPGIFRGRGEHPHAGKLKSRILPENVTVNVGLDNMIPKCDVPGHAWKAVVNNPEATWLGQFKDEGREKAGTKYLFLAPDSKIKSKNDIMKYGKAKKLKENIEKIRADYMRRMASKSMQEAQLGTATYLIDKLALRVGNEKSEDEADTVGCCSLRVEHITIEKDNKITLDFLGKDSMRFHQTIEVHPLAHKAIERFVKDKKPEEDLFHLINASRLNEYLKELMPQLSAKVFRTYNASITLQNELSKYEEKPRDDVDKKVKFYKNANREVAILCNHQKAVPKNFDEQLKRLEDKLKEKKKKLKELQTHKKNLAKDSSISKPKMPKTANACDTAIKKAKKAMETEEYKVSEKIENKNIALSTSKINYMDPRISVTWCKNNEVPIEKVFEKTLRMKFAWVMSEDLEWKF
ncbi:unnamed protein product [Moneuplotes crassus]|uniref:DNA topoisomerase I n=1 Tax=Euplotes crassus TaxID=5936 RepID=A0AAD1U657_EUPCR|nr:unnamed protein product [Moneuplotes crassus]